MTIPSDNYSEYPEQFHNCQFIHQQFSGFSSTENNYEIPNMNLYDFNIEEDEDQSLIPSSPLVAKNKDSTSYSSVLKYLRENFDIDQSSLGSGPLFSENYKRKLEAFQERDSDNDNLEDLTITPLIYNKFNGDAHKLKKIKLSVSPISTCATTSDDCLYQTPIKFLEKTAKMNIESTISTINLGVIRYENDKTNSRAISDREMKNMSANDDNNNFIRFTLDTCKESSSCCSELIDFENMKNIELKRRNIVKNLEIDYNNRLKLFNLF